MFTHNNKIITHSITVEDTPNGRYYTTPQGKVYPSITTLLGAKDKPWLREWRESMGEIAADQETERTATRGTTIHSAVERYLKNEPVPTEGLAGRYLGEFNSMKLRLKHVNNIYAQEIPLFSHDLKVAGRCDCVAEWDGVLSIVDFKTSTNDKQGAMVEDYYLQTTAYALMFEEMYGITVDDIVIVMSVEKGLVPSVFRQKVDTWIGPLVNRINTYYSSKK